MQIIRARRHSPKCFHVRVPQTLERARAPGAAVTSLRTSAHTTRWHLVAFPIAPERSAPRLFVAPTTAAAGGSENLFSLWWWWCCCCCCRLCRGRDRQSVCLRARLSVCVGRRRREANPVAGSQTNPPAAANQALSSTPTRTLRRPSKLQTESDEEEPPFVYFFSPKRVVFMTFSNFSL